ncbi:hypothetical protein DNTS_009460 [Danionella cerebrum]|uniref:Gla domain-containing protein n=1 Tax=Danionella cerebrum TaxID=2873325 RepID=A0A553PWX4_9TELE|nr:hypothetical protein DNTS_009460 [Danionella translucida]
MLQSCVSLCSVSFFVSFWYSALLLMVSYILNYLSNQHLSPSDQYETTAVTTDTCTVTLFLFLTKCSSLLSLSLSQPSTCLSHLEQILRRATSHWKRQADRGWGTEGEVWGEVMRSESQCFVSESLSSDAPTEFSMLAERRAEVCEDFTPCRLFSLRAGSDLAYQIYFGAQQPRLRPHLRRY